jgi:hypothetical protein
VYNPGFHPFIGKWETTNYFGLVNQPRNGRLDWRYNVFG